MLAMQAFFLFMPTSILDFLNDKPRKRNRRGRYKGDIWDRVMYDHPSTMPDYLKVPRSKRKKPSTLFY